MYSPAKVANTDFSRISNYSFWYAEDVLLKLSFISQTIETFDEDVRLFFKTALSEVVREASYTRNGEFKRFKMPANQVEKFDPDVFGMFSGKVMRNLQGLKQFNAAAGNAAAGIAGFDTVENIPHDILPPGSVDMIVTSPPYGDSHTTVAYGQFSRWSNEWFGHRDAQKLDNMLMGGKRRQAANFETECLKETLQSIDTEDHKRYAEVVSFLNDYNNSMRNIAQVVRHGGRICFVVGDRTVKGVQIPLDYFTAEMFERYGFKHETTIVREIPGMRMPSKNSPTNISGLKSSTMTNEYIVVMTKK